MAQLPRVRRWLLVLTSVAAVAALIAATRVPLSAQASPPTWVVEDVAPAGDTVGHSITVPNGLGFDPQNRLVAAWGDRCACGGYEQETWARREGGDWQFHPFLPGAEGSDLRSTHNIHAMGLTRAGTPVMVFDARYSNGNEGVGNGDVRPRGYQRTRTCTPRRPGPTSGVVMTDTREGV